MGKDAFVLTIAVLLGACSGEIYLRDGVTDGDTFYLAERALHDDDPVLQSWVGYSLSLSACKLGIGGENPARASSFACELAARRHLLDAWHEHRRSDPALSDAYLDTLTAVRDAGWLDEYVVHFHGDGNWTLPEDIDLQAFRAWQRRYYPRHKPATRIVGSWNYARNVRAKP
jgi:hypothetical protein